MLLVSVIGPHSHIVDSLLPAVLLLWNIWNKKLFFSVQIILDIKYWSAFRYSTSSHTIVIFNFCPPAFCSFLFVIDHLFSGNLKKACKAIWARSFRSSFLASQDALEVMRVTHLLTELLDVSIDFTEVTLVSDDTYRRYILLMWSWWPWWKLSSDEVI